MDLVYEFIDLCIDNYKNGGHSTTKKQEHRYYDLKKQFQIEHDKAQKLDGLEKYLLSGVDRSIFEDVCAKAERWDKLRKRIEERREEAHGKWSAEIIRKEGVNPSQREFVLDVELEKLLEGEK